MKIAGRKLLVSSLVLVLTLALTATSTFAWFNMNTTANVSNFEVQITSDSGFTVAVLANDSIGLKRTYTEETYEAAGTNKTITKYLGANDFVLYTDGTDVYDLKSLTFTSTKLNLTSAQVESYEASITYSTAKEYIASLDEMDEKELTSGQASALVSGYFKNGIGTDVTIVANQDVTLSSEDKADYKIAVAGAKAYLENSIPALSGKELTDEQAGLLVAEYFTADEAKELAVVGEPATVSVTLSEEQVAKYEIAVAGANAYIVTKQPELAGDTIVTELTDNLFDADLTRAIEATSTVQITLDTQKLANYEAVIKGKKLYVESLIDTLATDDHGVIPSEDVLVTGYFTASEDKEIAINSVTLERFMKGEVPGDKTGSRTTFDVNKDVYARLSYENNIVYISDLNEGNTMNGVFLKDILKNKEFVESHLASASDWTVKDIDGAVRGVSSLPASASKLKVNAIKWTIVAKTRSVGSIYVKNFNIPTVTATEEWNDVKLDEALEAADAIDDNVSDGQLSVDAADALRIKMGTTNVIFDKNSDKKYNNGEQDATTNLAWLYYQYYQKNNGKTFEAPVAGTDFNTSGEFSATKTAKIATTEATGTEYVFAPIDVMIWLEGGDYACFDTILNNTLKFSFDLTSIQSNI